MGCIPGHPARGCPGKMVRQDAEPRTLEARAPMETIVSPEAFGGTGSVCTVTIYGRHGVLPFRINGNERNPGLGRETAGKNTGDEGWGFHHPDEAPRPYREAWPILIETAYWSFSVGFVFARVWQ